MLIVSCQYTHVPGEGGAGGTCVRQAGAPPALLRAASAQPGSSICYPSAMSTTRQAGRAAGNWPSAQDPTIYFVDGDPAGHEEGFWHKPTRFYSCKRRAACSSVASGQRSGSLRDGAAHAGGGPRATHIARCFCRLPTASFHSAHQAAAMAGRGGARALLLAAAALFCLCCLAAGGHCWERVLQLEWNA